MSPFNNYVIRTIQSLSGSMQPTEAIAALQAANASHGVVIDEQGVPAALVVAEDLEQATSRGAPFLLHPLSTLPPVVIVGSKASMQDLVIRDTTLKSFIAGARGAVVLGDEGIFGIVPIRTIKQFQGTSQVQVGGGTLGLSARMGDMVLAGERTTPLCRVMCAECGFINELLFLDRRNLPPCQNTDTNVPPHTLKLR
ncbi:MAG: hypothetical protein JGK38_22985 [Microcoleus sp. PH2017_15_JOR_U_A]|jgi:CBS domain-containing protein|uniref:hypothetical protein n=2 Tax=unclassified Microcoleus TaxID=2642155 RepID=UPI001D34113D|nr:MULTISPECIES: hypothetical protein [unclassified Microcoleus]MCC3499427.1 hypothetical protein [Microcoleus sp. PH2017_15_JOR_U_A]MCC3600053.1 hypothetical protein [Microcoleus sp. PH2017_26_ELK_O_A]